MDLLDPLAQTFDHTTKCLAGVDASQLGAATPCAEWDVRTLVGHMLGVVTNMGLGARGEPLLEGPLTVALQDDLSEQFRTLADGTLAGWTARGSDGMVNIGAGPMPVEAALCVNLIDTAGHTWDVARATGQDAALPDDLAAAVLAVAQGFLSDELRIRAGFKPAVALAADASLTDQLAAYLGRQP